MLFRSAARHKNVVFLTNSGGNVITKAVEQTISLQSQQNYTWLNGIIKVKQCSIGMPNGNYILTTADSVRGQKLKAKGRPTKTVKAWLQETNIPAALRAHWPVLLMKKTEQSLEQYELVSIIGVAQAEHKLVASGLGLDYLVK